jgi:hypothetical protein
MPNAKTAQIFDGNPVKNGTDLDFKSGDERGVIADEI